MTKMNTWTILALIFIFLGGIGAILLTIGQYKSSSRDKNDIINITKSENKGLKKDIAELKNEREVLRKELIRRDSLLQKRNDTIVELSNKLSEKSEYIQKYLTGGNGYPFIDIRNFVTNSSNKFSGMFCVGLFSKFPIYNLMINIIDYDEIEKSISKIPYSAGPVIKMAEYNKAKVLQFQIDELSPTQFRIFGKKFNLTEARYYVQIQARNKTFIEKIASIRFGENLYFGYQLFSTNGKLIKQRLVEQAGKTVKAELLERLNSIPTLLDLGVIE